MFYAAMHALKEWQCAFCYIAEKVYRCKSVCLDVNLGRLSKEACARHKGTICHAFQHSDKSAMRIAFNYTGTALSLLWIRPAMPHQSKGCCSSNRNIPEFSRMLN